MRSIDSDVTERIAEHVAQRLKGGEIIDLSSDLGGGKTTFVRGLARGLGSVDKVASPTFTIGKVYKGGRLELHHFDFYRLADAGLAGYELHDFIGDPELAIVIEWGGVVEHVLPEERLSIVIERIADDENARELICTFPPSLAYLVEGLPQ
jgi:tRNA threonylcarbamoyladenosine biosynthesis protein TsaE